MAEVDSEVSLFNVVTCGSSFLIYTVFLGLSAAAVGIATMYDVEAEPLQYH